MDPKDIPAYARANNIFQYPTEHMSANIASVCLRRIDAMSTGEDAIQLRELLAHGTAEQAAQINMYLLMLGYRLIREFMLEVIAEKLRVYDHVLTRAEVGSWLSDLQQRSEVVGSWSNAGIAKCRQVLTRSLTQAGYIEPDPAHKNEFTLHQLLLDPQVEQLIASNGSSELLRAFRAGE